MSRFLCSNALYSTAIEILHQNLKSLLAKIRGKNISRIHHTNLHHFMPASGKMLPGSVKRPKISVASVNTSGKVTSRSVPLISPHAQPQQNQASRQGQEVLNTIQNTPFDTAYVNELLQVQNEDPKCEWEQVRSLLSAAYHETIAPDAVQCCMQSCRKQLQNNYIRCEDCGPFAFYCEACCNSVHCNRGLSNQQLLLFHKPKIWTEAGYKDYHIDILLDRPDHKCSTRRARTGLLVFDDKGRIHHCSIVICSCDKDQCVTLMRHNLWSASVKEPKVAFHFELMNWIEFLLLESAISLQSACLAIRWKNGFADDEMGQLGLPVDTLPSVQPLEEATGQTERMVRDFKILHSMKRYLPMILQDFAQFEAHHSQ